MPDRRVAPGDRVSAAALEVEGMGRWTRRSDGAWFVQSSKGNFEARPASAGRYHLWWSSVDLTQARMVGTYHESLESAADAAIAYEPSSAKACPCAGECTCGCAHKHPPSVPTEPCPSSSEERKPSSTSGYATRLDFATSGEATRFARSLRRRSQAAQHIHDRSLYTNSSSAHIVAAQASTKIKPAFQSIGGGHERASEEALVIHEPGASSELAHVTRDAKVFGACMDRSRKIGPIKDAAKIYAVLAPELQKQDQEIFVVVPLDLHYHIRGCGPIEIARGQRSSVTVGVDDVLRAGLVQGAKGIVVAHNHPTGLAKPSADDVRLTRLIETGCRAVNVDFIDHVIIGLKQYCSIREWVQTNGRKGLYKT